MIRLSRIPWVATLIVCAAFSTVFAEENAGDEPTPLALFDQRIMPIFRSEQPSSCVQCHLAAVDLKNYILPSHEKTFASLRDQGLVDLAHPEKSKILTLIRMGDKDLDKGAKLIHEKTRQAEYEAFASWIEACCNDPKLRNAPTLTVDKHARPERPDAVIRHARKSRVVDSFVRNVWSQRMRCFPCHTPHEIDASNPRHQAAVKTQRQFQENYGEALVKRLNIFRETPEATLQYLIERSRNVSENELPLINLDEPRQSLILLKPMSKLPVKNPDGKFEAASSSLPVTHMGGLKMHKDDQSYKAFVAWLEDYAKVVGNRYAAVEELLLTIGSRPSVCCGSPPRQSHGQWEFPFSCLCTLGRAGEFVATRTACVHTRHRHTSPNGQRSPLRVGLTERRGRIAGREAGRRAIFDQSLRRLQTSPGRRPHAVAG